LKDLVNAAGADAAPEPDMEASETSADPATSV